MSPGAAPNLSTLRARTLAGLWAARGLEHVCLGSGSRSAPLVEAFGRLDGLTLHPHVDERSAAFFALGVASRTGRPVAVVTTSGTAAANLFPAVIEAAQSGIPLLALTADRPARLRGLDANQTIDQVDLFGRYPRLAMDLPAPKPDAGELAVLEGAASRAWEAALGPPPGPVHVNVQLEKPLEPSPVPGGVPPELDNAARDLLAAAGEGDAAGPGRAGRVPGRRREDGARSGRDPGRGAGILIDALARASRPLLVAGPTHDPMTGPAALALAKAAGLPLLADPLSGARFAPGAAAVALDGVGTALDDPDVVDALVPDLVVRIGPTPTSAASERYLAGLRGTRQIALTAGGRWPDHDGVLTDTLFGDVRSMLAAAGASPPSFAAWRADWARIQDAVTNALEPILASTWFEGAVARAVADSLRDGGVWLIGNSMPIRDVDAFGGSRDVDVRTIGFRGASGIDGNVSGALGAA